MAREKDICKHIGLPPNRKVQRAYDAHENAKEAEKRASDAFCEAVDKARRAQPLLERLVFAAHARCMCGAGLAYDQVGRPTKWECSAVLLGTATSGEHESYSFIFYEIKSERQPSQGGATTRPK